MTEPRNFVAVQHGKAAINREPAIAEQRGDEPEMNL
jgi:hypothetical protein